MPLTALALPTLVMLLILLLPGGVLAAVLGLRGTSALAVAFAASVAIVAVAGILTGIVPLGWGWAPVAVVAVFSALIAAGVRLLQRRIAPVSSIGAGRWGGRNESAAYLGIALAGIIIAFAILRGVASADNFSQTYDNFFHMALIRWFLEHGSASTFVPLDFGNPDSGSYFYPAVWHQLASLLITTGVTDSIPVAQNALTLVVAGAIWPTSVVFLARSVVGGGPAFLLGVGLVSAAFSSFPYLLVGYGVLYPLLLAVSLLPVGVGVAFQALRFGDGERLPWPHLVAIGVIAAGAMSIAHPNALLGGLAISLSLVAVWAVRGVVRAVGGTWSWGRAAGGIAVFALLTTVTAVLWTALRPGPFWWSPESTGAEAFGEFLMASPMGRPPAFTIFFLLLGTFVLFTRTMRRLYLLAPAAVLLGLWLAVSAMDDPDMRDFLVGGFYTDPNRVAAMIPVVLLLLTLPALSAIERWLEGAPMARFHSNAVLAGFVVVLALVTQADRPVREEVEVIGAAFERRPSSANVTPDEYQMIRDLPEFVSPEDLVVLDAKTGAAMIYPLEGLQPIQYHPNDSLTAAEREIVDGLSRTWLQNSVCAAVNEVGADWVLDFGTDQVNMHLFHDPPLGLQRLEHSPLVTLVHEVGEARLYQITGCGG